MGKAALNKKTKRVLLTKQKLTEKQPEGKQTPKTKKILSDFEKSQGKVRYRGKTKRLALTEKAAKESRTSQLKGMLTKKIVEEVKETARTGKKPKKVQAQFFKTAQLSKDEKQEMIKQELDHMEYVMNCDEFKKDPGAAILEHIDATLDAIKPATGRNRYNPSAKRKAANVEAKALKEQRSTAKAQKEQLSGFQTRMNSVNPYAKGVKKPAPKAAGRKAGARGAAKPWLSAH